MKKNEKIRATGEDITNQGYGVVRVNSQVVFVPDLLVGEDAQIQIVKVLKKYAYGKVLKRYTTSPDRKEPVCKVAGACGGCSFQHVTYSKQLEIKTQYVRHLLQINHIEAQVHPTLGMKQPYYYRNKAQFPVQVEQDRVRMGFYRVHSHSIVECEECPIQSRSINKIFQWLRQHVSVDCAQGLRHVLIRSNQQDRLQVVFIGEKNIFGKLASKMSKELPQVESIIFNENKRSDNVILGENYTVLYGKDTMIQMCLGQKIELHFKSFFQVNPEQMNVLYAQAIQMADLTQDQIVIDLYSGVGTISCAIAPYVQKVIGVEIVPEAVENAKRNADINHLRNVEFVQEDASTFVSRYSGDADVVIVDPPRKGLSQIGINHIVGLRPDRVVYISCNPNTWVRDAKLFEQEGYVCSQVQPVDMFCQTSGLECVSVFDRKS